MIPEMEWFVSERAENLALVHLTRREDLVVTRSRLGGHGLDLLVTICKDGAVTGRMFGVEVKGRMEALPSGGMHRVRLSTAESRRFADIAFPVCVLLFTMEDDRGYYRWAREPRVGSNRMAGLKKAAAEAEWLPLTDDALAVMVDAVDAWYDARMEIAA